jgi:hypothetical protein
MRPDDVRLDVGESAGADAISIASDLRPLDAELAESGVRARRMLHGRTQPTNYFAIDLRARLLAAYSGEAPARSATLDVTAPRSQVPAAKPVARPRPAPAPQTQVLPRQLLAAPSMLVTARWGLVAAAVATGLLIVSALGTGAIPR